MRSLQEEFLFLQCMKQPISITAVASISALGSNLEEVWQNYLFDEHFLSEKDVNGKKVFVGQISEENQKIIADLKRSDSKYKNLDDLEMFTN